MLLDEAVSMPRIELLSIIYIEIFHIMSQLVYRVKGFFMYHYYYRYGRRSRLAVSPLLDTP